MDELVSNSKGKQAQSKAALFQAPPTPFWTLDLQQEVMLKFKADLPVSNNMTKKIPTGDFLVGFRCSSADN